MLSMLVAARHEDGSPMSDGEIRPADPRSERIFRRAITETPRHNANVILS